MVEAEGRPSTIRVADEHDLPALLRLYGQLGDPDALPGAEESALLALPHVRTGTEQPGCFALLREVGQPLPSVGKLIHDADIVALMRQQGVDVIWTHDQDFRKFDGIRVIDPSEQA